MSSKTVSPPSDEDVSLEAQDARSASCDLIDSTYSVLGSFIADKNEGVEEAHTDNDQPEEDDGVDVIDEESVSENQEVLEVVQDVIGSNTGIYPKIHPSTEEQSSTTQIAQSGTLGKSSSSSDTTANKAGLPKIFAQVPLDIKMNLVFFIISTLLLAGYMQCRIDYVLQEYNQYKSETQAIIQTIQDDHNKYKLETQGIIKAIQDDLKQEHYNNELLTQKMESMNTQLQQFQHGGSAAMSAYIKNQIEMETNLCPVFVEILQAVEFFVQTGDHSDVIQKCGDVIFSCLKNEEVQIKLFLESDGLHLLGSISAQLFYWGFVLKILFDRWNDVYCTQEYVGHLLHLLDSDLHGPLMSQAASGILCKCLDEEVLWDSKTAPTKHQVSVAVSKAIETWKSNPFWYVDMESMATWVKKSSATAQQHFAAWALYCKIEFKPSSNREIKNLIGEVILEEILKDPRPNPHTKVLIQKILDK